MNRPIKPSARVILVERASHPTDEVRGLIDDLERELSVHYSPGQRHGLKVEALFQPGVGFFLARSDGEAVGCGGLAFLDGFAEVKRMFVRPAARGRGIAAALLARLETEARDQQIRTLRLETGVRQHEAMRLYARHGFRPCPPFPPYTALPPEAVVTSVFLEKSLA